MLCYDNNSNDGPFDYEKEEDKKFRIPRYSCYEVEHTHGYNNGDAHFENIIPGRYILKIKTEASDRDMQFVLNYCSDSNLVMREIELSKEETSLLTRESMISLMPNLPKATLNKVQRNDQLVFANKFEAIGYGFVAIRSSK